MNPLLKVVLLGDMRYGIGLFDVNSDVVRARHQHISSMPIFYTERELPNHCQFGIGAIGTKAVIINDAILVCVR
jgi:hypothetical protein